MRTYSMVPALLSLMLLAACTNRPEKTQTPAHSETGTEAAETSPDAPNEKTPNTADSLEVQPTDTETGIDRSVTGSGTILEGSPENPHRLIIVSDDDCAYCRQFLTDDLPWIETEFVAKGSLTVERVFLPFSKDGEHAARLAICAAEQRKFPEADAWLNRHSLASVDSEKFAKAVGVNLKKLLACTARKNLLEGNLKRAKESNVERVPFFVLGSDSWLGLLQKKELRTKIETILRE